MTIENTTPTGRDRQLSRRQWLSLYFPMIVGALSALAAIVLLAVIGFREENLGSDPASAWGDAAALLVIIQVAVIGVIPLALLVALSALLIKIIPKIQPVLKRGQEITHQGSIKINQVTDGMTARMIKPYAFYARLCAISQFLRRTDV